VQAACLTYARAADEFIAIIDGSYGRAENLAEVCVLELELLTAALAGKPFHLFLLEPYSPDPRTESLLHALRLAHRHLVDRRPKSGDEILTALTARLATIRRDGRQTRRPQPRPVMLEDLDVRFLDGRFMPLFPDPPSPELVQGLLKNAGLSTSVPGGLVDTWMALRHLCSAPYSDPAFAAYLPLWDVALSRWASAAAWYGLHGAQYLGRLAAVNTLLWIRRQPGVRPGACVDSLAIHGTYGGLASEYDSIAKQAPTPRQRRALLNRALATVDRAIEETSSDPSGLYGLRVLAMAGGTPEHARLAANVIGELRSVLRGRPCSVFTSDARVRIEATDRATYPDVTVVCGRLEHAGDDPDSIANPVVIVELLSDATEAEDRGEKFAHYRRLHSLREYVLVSQRARRLEVYRRRDDRWLLDEAASGDSLRLESIDVELLVDEVYRDPLATNGR
jgi:Uma2 family endonuclease